MEIRKLLARSLTTLTDIIVKFWLTTAKEVDRILVEMSGFLSGLGALCIFSVLEE